MQLISLPDASAYLVYDEHFLDPSSPNGLWLCTTAEEAQVIACNAAALPINATEENLIKARPFLAAFSCVLVVGVDEAKRRTLSEALQRLCPELEVCVTPQSAYRGCTSIQELKDNHGLSALDDLWMDADQLPPYGLLEASSIEQSDILKQPKARSGIHALDQRIGGLYDSELSIWTGKRKEGKSTMLGLPILAALREGRRVCVYSGELPAGRYIAWLLTMAAGPSHVVPQKIDTGKTVYSVCPEIAAQITLWWKDKLFVVDNKVCDIHRSGTLLGVLRHAHKRYGCSCFVLDNLMTIALPGEDKYDAQSRFVGQLVDFAHETHAHVHLVAHRRKGGGTGRSGRQDNDDVSGSGDITNRADNVFAVSRSTDKEDPFDAQLEILANRDFGETGVINLNFDVRSRRYYQSNVNWKCGWENSAPQTTLYEDPSPDPDNPFL